MPTHKDVAKRHRSAGLRLSETPRGSAVQSGRAVARSNGGFGADASQRDETPANATAGIKLSIVLGSGTQIGPDKIALLENIRDAGSISGAARYMGIQYKRAWMLLDSMCRAFKQPVVKSITAVHGAGRRNNWPHSERRASGTLSADFAGQFDAARILPALAAIGCCGSSRDWTHGVSRRRFADLPFGSSQAMLLWV